MFADNNCHQDKSGQVCITKASSNLQYVWPKVRLTEVRLKAAEAMIG